MKAKLKGANGFTRFMLAHGEKLGMGAVLALAGLLIYSSFGRPTLEAGKQPTNLQQNATQANSKVQDMKWEDFPAEEQINPTTVLVKVDPNAKVVGETDPYLIRDPNPLPIPKVGKRTDPELLAVENPEVSTGSGLWAWADPEVIKRRMLDERRRAQEEERRAEEEAEEMEEDGGRGRGGRGGRGGFDGGRGGFGFGGDGLTTKDGAIVVQDNGGAQMQGYEDIRNTSWAIVKAKVPYRAQYKNYEDALMTTMGYSPQADIPTYIGYEVQRAEVTDQGDEDWVTIKKVVPKVLINDMESWPIQTPDIINPKYSHPLLTYPLPPMVLRPWDESVTHSELPIPTPEDLMREAGGEDPRGGDQERRGRRNRDNDDEEEGDLFQGAAESPRNAQGGFDGGRGGFDGGRGGFGGGRGGFDGGRGGTDGGRGGFMMGGRGGFDGGRGGFGGGRGGFDGGRGGGVMGGGAGSVDPTMFTQYTWDGTTRYLLFRYFDYTVEPGKKYRYRVRLALKDVNESVQARFLDEAVIARRAKENAAFVLTPYSKPTPVAVVPQAGLVYVAGAKPANASNYSSEPEAELLIKGLDNRSASEAALEEMFTRGTVLNLIAQQAKVIWSSTFETTDREGNPVESPKFNFRTGLTLLDFVGGEPLNNNRELTAPARVVLMDSAGRITIKNELDDLKPVVEYDYYKASADEAARMQREREEGGGGRGGFGGGRGGGGRGGGRGGRD